MNLKQLHELTGRLLSERPNDGLCEVAINNNTFIEGDGGENILTVGSAQIESVVCQNPDADELEEESVFVLRGE